MIYLIIYFIIILIAFYFLIKSSDYLVSSSSILGERVGISKFVIGLTLVAIGTSLPELFTALFAIFDSSNPGAFVFGTVIGSNIANILLVFGILLFFSKNFKVKIKLFDLLFLLVSTFSLIFLIYFKELNIFFSISYITLFILYLFSSVKFGSKKKFNEEVKEIEEEVDEILKNAKSSTLIFIFILSLVGLNIGAKGVIYGIEKIGNLLSIPLIYLTFTTVAFATSLPEIMVSVASAKKKEFDIAVGNIIGSNISNILLILGVVSFFKTIPFIFKDYIFSFSILFITTLFFAFLLIKEKISKKYSYLLIGSYIIYIIFLIFL